MKTAAMRAMFLLGAEPDVISAVFGVSLDAVKSAVAGLEPPVSPQRIEGLEYLQLSGNFWLDQILRRQYIGKRFEKFLQSALTRIMPDPPPTSASDEHSLAFSFNSAGLNEIIASRPAAVEVIEVFFLLEGGSQVLSLEVEEKIVLPKQTFATNTAVSVPPFDLPNNRALQLRLGSSLKVTGRVRFRSLDPGIVLGGY